MNIVYTLYGHVKQEVKSTKQVTTEFELKWEKRKKLKKKKNSSENATAATKWYNKGNRKMKRKTEKITFWKEFLYTCYEHSLDLPPIAYNLDNIYNWSEYIQSLPYSLSCCVSF